MEGRLFLYSKATPPPTPRSEIFVFDLQRFATEVSTLEALKTALTSGGEIELTADITANEGFNVTTATTLNLGTHKLTINNADYGIQINDNASLTVNGTTGSIEHTTTAIDSTQATQANTESAGSYVSNTIKNVREKAAIKVGNAHAKNANGVSLTVNGGTIKSNSTAINAGNGSTVTINADGKVESTYSCGIYVGNAKAAENGTYVKAADGQLNDDIELNINGTVRSAETSNLPAIQVSGTLSYNVTTININEGSLVEYANHSSLFGKDGSENKSWGNPDAIYAGGNNILNISGGTVTSGGTGIELRGGALNVTGGTITSTATDYKVNDNKDSSSGGQVYGAAIAMAQHSTGLNVETTVKSGEISGQIALAVENPIESTTNNTISAKITGGNFESTGTGAAAIAAQASDSRSKINIDGEVTFKGKVESTVATTGESTTPTITFGENAKVTVITKKTVINEETGEEEEVEVEETYDTNSVTFSENWKDSDNKDVTETYPVNSDAWNASHQNPTGKFFYLVKNTDDSKVAGAKATLAPKTGSEDTILELTTSDDFTSQSLEVDLSALNSIGLDTKFKTIDASAVPDKVALNITGNDKITAITGGKGADSLTAGSEGVSLNGNGGNDLLIGGKGDDTFIFTAGKDTIDGYDAENDNVSIGADLTAPVDFDNVKFDGSDFVISLGSADNVLTFKSTNTFSLTDSQNTTYSYGANKNGISYIAKKGAGISLGSGYTSKTYDGRELDYQTIDASNVTISSGLTIRGNDNASSLIGAQTGGAIYGGMGGDTLKSRTATGTSLGTVLDGGDGKDYLIGGGGRDTFVYSAGADSIEGYDTGDLVNIKGFNPADATFSVSGDGDNISLGFGDNDNLTFIDVTGKAVSVKGNTGNYVYTKDYVAHNGKSITLAADYSGTLNGADSAYAKYETIDASAVTSAISIVGNDNNNLIIGGASATLYGGKGNDKLNVTERVTGENPAKFVFKYTEGKDDVIGFNEKNDKLDIDDTLVGNIASGKASNGKLAFTFKNKSNKLTFRANDDISSVSLQNGKGFLTKDGVVSIPGGSTDNRLDLFAKAKGKIDLTSELYSISGGIKTVDASKVAKQSVTLIGASVDGGSQYTFTTNKKKDMFEYNGGSVSISGYEAGVDRLDLNTAALTGFSVGTGTDTNVSLTTGLGTVVLESMKGHEVLLHHAGSRHNSFTKMVFKDTGVILNKEKRPTAATVYSGNYNATVDSSIKKIYAADSISGAKITAGNRNKTTLDASAAGTGVTLVSGDKNDKLIGSTSTVEGAGDTFIYAKGGKDIIQNYGSNDQISLGSFANEDSILSAKINAGSRSIKFKFSNKNALTVKPTKGSTLDGALNISGLSGYTYAKNAVISGSNASLTSEFSGSYRLKNSKATVVDGSRVEKNLTYKGTSADETLSGGTKKTTFKGGGGADNLIGGSGKDVFFYAKGDKGDATIADFDFDNDKLKIASGTITKISTVSGGGIQFDMNKGKTSANVGSFKITSSATYDSTGRKDATFNPNSTLIKANNTYLWFADDDVKDDDGNVLAKAGDLITTVSKVSKSQVSDYAVIDLGYSSNLVNAGVATKVTGTFEKLKPSNSGGTQTPQS